MQNLQKIRCPNCGSEAERHAIDNGRMTRTQCSCCDYLMVTCTKTGKVIEAYAPGINAQRLSSLRRAELPTSSISFQSSRVTHANSNLMLLQDVHKSLNPPKSGTVIVRFPNGVVGD